MIDDAPLRILDQAAAPAGSGEAELSFDGAVRAQDPDEKIANCETAREPAGSMFAPQHGVRRWPLTMRYLLTVSGSL